MRDWTQWLLLFGCALSLLVTTCAASNLYAVLGVPRSASPKAIRNAYLKLAMKWHPDKNRSPEAPDMMAKINKAYDVLSNEKRRKRYDAFGQEDESPYQHNQRHRPSQQQGSFSFNGHTFTFNFNSHSSNDPPDDISTRRFFDDVVPGSRRKPQLIYFYNDWCPSCPKVTKKWVELKDELLNLGIVTASVDTMVSSQAARFCKVNMAPKVELVLNRKCYSFNERLGIDTVVRFVASSLPGNVLFPLPDDPSLSAADRIRANKPLFVAFSILSNPLPSLLLTAFSLREFSSVAYATDEKGQLWRKRLEVPLSKDVMVVLKEEGTPASVKEYSESDPVSLKRWMEKHKLMSLPRLSSQSVMEVLCPFEPTSRACLVLLVEDPAHYNHSLVDSFRLLAVEKAEREEVSLAYLDSSKQSDFLQALGPIPTSTRECPNGVFARPVFILKRYSVRRARYNWFEGYCGLRKDWDNLVDAAQDDLRYDVFLNLVKDEFAPELIAQLYESIEDYVSENTERLMTFVVIFLPFMLITFGSAACRRKRVASDSHPTQRHPLPADNESLPLLDSKDTPQHHPSAARDKNEPSDLSERESSKGPPHAEDSNSHYEKKNSPKPTLVRQPL